ncbi:MAG: TRAP transporter substrate-binding protein, partial [Deltaproteobacteria bacterium]
MNRDHPFRYAILLLPLGAVAFLLLLGGAGKSRYTIKFGTVAPPDTPWAIQLNDIKERVERESKGKIRFKLYLGGQLGGEIEMVQQVRRGRIQGGGFSTGAIADIVPELSILELPYLFRDEAEADRILDEIAFEPLSEKLAEKGFYLAYWGENGWRSFGTKTRPIRKPEDLAGMKMRVQENPVHIEMYKALGATGIPLPVVEVIGALQTGLVDGFDNTPLFSVASEWIYKVKYYTLTRHIYQPAAIIFNKRF